MAWKIFEAFDFYDAVYYGYLYCKMAGLWPLAWRPGGKDYPLINFSILGVWFISINYFLYDNLTDFEFWENFHRTTDSLILTWGTRIQNIASLILGIVIVIMSFAHVAIKKEHFHAMFDTIVYVDKIFEKEFHYDMQFKFLKKLIFLCTVFVMFTLSSCTIISFFIFEHMLGLRNPKFYCSFFMANLPFVGTITSYLVFTISIRTRFIYINKIFEQMRCEKMEGIIVKQTKDVSSVSTEIWKDKRSLFTKLKDFLTAKSLVNHHTFTKTSTTEAIQTSIVRLIHLHSKLCDCVNQVNDIFSVKLLISAAFMFVFIVFACFNGYRVLYHSHIKGDIVALSNLFWMCYYIGLVVSITTTSSLACNAAKYTGRVVHRVIHRTWDPIIVQKLTLASQQLLMRKPSFTCHLFAFDFSLLFSMVSANATYLVFLIQLEVANKSKVMQMLNRTISGLNDSSNCHTNN